MRRLFDLAKRFRKDESGAFMVLFAVLAIVLIAVAGSVVDFTYTQTARTRAQTALDSAALALQTRISIDDNATLKSKAQSILTQRLGDADMTGTVNTVTIDTTSGKINIQASLTVPTAFVQLVGVHNITSQLTSEVQRGSKDLEVSVALDTTLSMQGSKIAALISAINTPTTGLIDMVVQTAQTPTYSKMAIIPWSNAVNVNTTSYASGKSVASVRGTPTPGIAIQSATWKSGSAVNISAITKAKPAVVTTSSAHGLVNGDPIYITGVKGMTSVNGSEYIVHNKTSTTLELWDTSGNKVDTSGASKYTSAGTVQKCLTAACEIIVTTSAAHNFAQGDTIYVTGTSGLSSPTDIDGVQTVGAVTSTTFVWPNVFGPSENAYSSGGTTYCTKYGCTYYYFANVAGSHTLYQVNNCATERTTDAYTDAAPSTTALSFNYTSGGATCITQAIQPLTSNKTTLHNLAGSLTAAGSTAGHLGLAWGWYMLAPNFGYLWPTASQPAAYGRANLIKAVILMTDGQFNLQYCNGVLDSDAGSGTSHINCTSPNGDSRTQAEALCDAIKAPANDIILYTVGFYLGTDTDSLNFLRDCATAPSDFFQADSGTDLSNAFTAIAQNLNNLRISK